MLLLHRVMTIEFKFGTILKFWNLKWSLIFREVVCLHLDKTAALMHWRILRGLLARYSQFGPALVTGHFDVFYVIENSHGIKQC